MSRRFTLLAVLVAGAMIAMPGCHKENKTTTPAKSTTAMGAMNDKCPLTHEPVNSSSPTTAYHGKTVAFCCGGCAAKFNAMSDAEKDKKLASVATAK